MQNRMQAPEPASKTQENEEQTSQRLGPFLCWAVVFADIGTSIYYVPGILYGTVGRLAGFFVLLTMIVFILLTFKYVEVTYRFPQGGGVVTVAARALNRWFGALGGMFILVDYFLTAAISCLSGMLYLSVVLPAIGPQTHFLGQSITLWITLVILVLLGILNWVGVSESAKVSLIGAVIAFISDIAILVTVFAHMSLSTFLGLFPQMFSGRAVTPVLLLTGFAGSFLAFSGLESISQLSPDMKLPRRTVGKLALFLVILTVGLTSPLLTILSTLLLPKAAVNSVLSSQLISLLGGYGGGLLLQTEVAISASALLVFASNTAIIGSYHVFMALSRMEFFPQFILKRNALRGTPHYSIALSTLIPIIVLLLVHGDINTLGDMYAFGLLGAFTLTCLSMDIVRYRERKVRRREAAQGEHPTNLNEQPNAQGEQPASGHETQAQDTAPEGGDGQMAQVERVKQQTASSEAPEAEGRWTRSTLNFWLGIITTVLVLTAWSTNLVAKPLATAFGGSVALVGMGIAYTNATIRKRRGRVPVLVTGVERDFSDAVLAVLTSQDGHNEAVMHAALHNPSKQRVVFLYLGGQTSARKPEMFRLVEPHLHDDRARIDLGRANHQAQEAGVECRFIYRHQEPGAAYRVWQTIQPREALVATEQAAMLQQINPDRTYNETLPEGEVTHLVKNA
ncbi:MAG: APC family permease [Chloroflexota bacterium]|nr:APC family permease [Chloroflexota bacterium]